MNMKKILFNKSDAQGFTLIELLVVIAIIGILTSIVFPNLLGNKAKARDLIRQGDLKSLGQATDLYFAEHGYKFPESNTTFYSDIAEYFADGVVPTDPKDGTNYVYNKSVNSSGKFLYYCIAVKMEVVPNDAPCAVSGFPLHLYSIKGP